VDARPARVRVCVGVLAIVLTAGMAVPASAAAADLFPVDDWLGDGIKKAGEVALGPLKVGVEEIARLLATVVGAIADLLVPKSLVRAGLDGVRWLVSLPPVGTPMDASGQLTGVRMPHLLELRQTLTWIGITLLPLGLVLAAGRSMLDPSVDGESPAVLVGRAVAAAVALLAYDWAWGVLVRLVRLITDALLGLPWVADGVERMLETLLIGGAAGTAVAAEFVVPLLVAVAGGALLGLLLVHVGLEVVCALVYALGGLVLGLAGTGFGRRLLAGWLVAVSAVVVLPVLWSLVFVVGAALMLDSGQAPGGGLGAFVAQLFNVAAALAVFWLAIKLALGVFRQANGAITGLAGPGSAVAGRGAGARASGGPGAGGLARNATPAGLARFSQSVRSGTRSAGLAAMTPVRHPAQAARAVGGAVRHPVQATRQAAGGLRNALADATPSRTAATNATNGTKTSNGPNGSGHGRGRNGRSTDNGSASGARQSGDPAGKDARAGQRARQRPAAGKAGSARGRGRGPSGPPGSAPLQRRPGSSRAGRSVRLSGPTPWWWGMPRRPRGGDGNGGDRRGSGGGGRS
jgi:hypothetical protein